MKNFIFKLLVCISFFTSCDKDEPNNLPELENTKSDLTLMTNINDPLLAIHKDNDVETYYYGERDNKGIPLGINLVEVVRQKNTTLISFNENGQPKKIFTQNGVQISLDWLSNESASVVMVSPNGEQQINFIVNPSETSSKVNPKSLATSRLNKKIITNRSLKALDFNKIKNTNKGNVKINTSSCFKPTNVPRVDLIVKSNVTGLWKGRFPAKKGSETGEYYTTIPTKTAAEINIKEDICTPLADAFKITCKIAQNTLFLDALCISLSAAIASSGIGAPVAAPFFAACEATVFELRLICPFNKITIPLATKLCESPEVNRTFTESLKIYAVASGAVLTSDGGNSITSTTEVVDGRGPFPSLKIELGSETSISPLTISPSIPKNGQSYNVYIDLLCVYQNTKVEFTVVGTDGFNDTNTSISSTTSMQPSKNETFYFNIPGADTGVRDKITIKITFPDGTSKTRKASLIFS